MLDGQHAAATATTSSAYFVARRRLYQLTLDAQLCGSAPHQYMGGLLRVQIHLARGFGTCLRHSASHLPQVVSVALPLRNESSERIQRFLGCSLRVTISYCATLLVQLLCNFLQPNQTKLSAYYDPRSDLLQEKTKMATKRQTKSHSLHTVRLYKCVRAVAAPGNRNELIGAKRGATKPGRLTVPHSHTRTLVVRKDRRVCLKLE